jgi:hypothetical protein
MRSASSSWLVATVDTALFMSAWLGCIAVNGRPDSLDLIFGFGALLFPAAVVFWWGFGWPNEWAAGKATLANASVQGLLWGGVFATFILLILAVSGPRVTAAYLFSLEILQSLLVGLVEMLAYFGLGGFVTGAGLHLVNSALASVVFDS